MTRSVDDLAADVRRVFPTFKTYEVKESVFSTAGGGTAKYFVGCTPEEVAETEAAEAALSELAARANRASRLALDRDICLQRAEAAEKELGGPLSYPITGGYVLIDRSDLPLVTPYKWSIQTDGRGREFALATTRATGKKRSVRMHRLILDAPEDAQVDHVNGNTLDNRRDNLRLATAADNQRNKDDATSESGYKGVHRKKRGGWEASISVAGKNRALGRFPTPEEAALARDVAALELHGEFASTNYPSCVVREVVSLRAALASVLHCAYCATAFLPDHTPYTHDSCPGCRRGERALADMRRALEDIAKGRWNTGSRVLDTKDNLTAPEYARAALRALGAAGPATPNQHPTNTQPTPNLAGPAPEETT